MSSLYMDRAWTWLRLAMLFVLSAFALLIVGWLLLVFGNDDIGNKLVWVSAGSDALGLICLIPAVYWWHRAYKSLMSKE